MLYYVLIFKALVIPLSTPEQIDTGSALLVLAITSKLSLGQRLLSMQVMPECQVHIKSLYSMRQIQTILFI